MKTENVSIKIGGEAGYGIMSTGFMLSKIFAKKGYYVIDTNEYPSLIKGGHNTYTVRVGTSPIYSISKSIDVLIALDSKTIDIHRDEISYGSHIIYDEQDFDSQELSRKRKDLNYMAVPFTKIIKEIKAPPVMRNNVALGAAVALVGLSFDLVHSVIKQQFASKGEKVVELNTRVADLGYKYIKEKLNNSLPYNLEVVKQKNKMMVTGNDAVFLGAVRSGCKFYVAYPMTPSSSILHSFAAIEDEYNIVTKHAESELAVVNMALGASFAGARTMLATSGGGFSLMNEGLSAAAMTETPLVMVLSQRPAPATGLPTWTEQGDMMFAVHAAHGEYLRIVMAPGDPEECFYMTGKAFNLADKYQIPVIILLDKHLSESHFSCEKFDASKIKVDRGQFITQPLDQNADYKRYKINSSGISPRVAAGLKGGVHVANTDEHDQYGFSCEDANNRKEMMDKRFNKVNTLIKDLDPPKLYGPPEAEITCWSWGSCKGPILEAMKTLNRDQKKVNLVHFTYLYPFMVEPVNKLIKDSNRNVLIENNKTAQLGKLLMMNTGFKINNRILKYNGRQFLPEEIISGIEQL
ncbi:MAG: 2-oxoacid:acceptor oxidoreductase subunit alpha [Actinomycetota bacterium]|nr:2-oxoacid:acceptor oxidoreductase subunit alpha [Actinomycetota bacterium]